MSNRVTFAILDRLLDDLGFVETTVPNSYVAYEHPPSGALLVLRLHRPADRVDPATLAHVRLQLVERGLIEPEAFDRLLQGTAA